MKSRKLKLTIGEVTVSQKIKIFLAMISKTITSEVNITEQNNLLHQFTTSKTKWKKEQISEIQFTGTVALR